MHGTGGLIMSGLIDKLVRELMETSSTGSKDAPDFTFPMLKRTLGKWSYKCDSDKDCHVFCTDQDKLICNSTGNLQLMSYSVEMYRLLWKILAALPDVNYVYGDVMRLVAKIYVEPDPDLNITEELISEVKAF